ncbi:MAG: trans-2-enoyl-CoA reductase family protein [Pseudomonadales bacterium]|jgi:enoyl-[acyl-carrier protein] reductase / trans-2-enoyl-CoA reductase (NAD+)|nr:trans-2-enoyl-CoA reductase family protein [Pseudomonadales bacterium]MDP4641116.1 trans-2-enoyl-CoA reductase family protein [Pseudomonadales bacterium]MDP4766093.1 trans-2-enoyl-CoA reductase family protein [Pseudomonadales bacterium]MDP4875080.1 trans-2-enoyl-CoA reductase family protein [Pseudomonadales bacterium]MDP4910734.1 trans-2-enoyl-CoA reductase family protein [Pseudomonadales bacterium]
MIIKPRIKGFLCTTAHPLGCAMDVQKQIAHVQQSGTIAAGPKRVLVIGASGGYGLASRITAAFGCGAATIGVFFERPAVKNRTASPGWYKSAAFTRQAHAAGLYATNINGDAFSAELKQATIDLIKRDLGQVDMVIYSLAAPARQLPDGSLVRSTLKPVGEPFEGATIELNSGELRSVSLEPASQQEVNDTVKVMGGEDWELWMAALLEAGVLADGCMTTNYTYLGSEVTWPIYYHGTIGKAKEDLDRAARALQVPLAAVHGKAYVAVMKGLMTQAASAIPGMSIYLSLLFKIMKQKGSHEGCVEQTTRLFQNLFNGDALQLDESGRLRLDDWELQDDIQAFVKANWAKVTADNLMEISDFAGYRQAFLQMHGFDFPEVDYEAEIDPEVGMTLAFGA